ncbi:hypothetical protein [Billgrantia gudaonensis]|uniref:Uncharacterized protein n=1 Tax=Billgrantia gudaonensis TaxID=376427 RepID=A0A1G9A1U5_9GAMM|nr:hypothetical protein [Halomonas gudaonensis]SDK21293.1 hypothetical protein SAMN04487954_11323 [Halomonas gudaonensis]
MPLLGFRRAPPRRGASQRRAVRRLAPGAVDRWLDRAVDVAVITALLVSGSALVLTRLM